MKNFIFQKKNKKENLEINNLFVDKKLFNSIEFKDKNSKINW